MTHIPRLRAGRDCPTVVPSETVMPLLRWIEWALLPPVLRENKRVGAMIRLWRRGLGRIT